jgi:pimeloyl-ACP methyl ester carboxylesterase
MSSPMSPLLPRQFVQLGQYQAAYQTIGSGPTLIFLHGFLGSGDNWAALWPALAADYHCIALDLLGFGESAKPQLNYTIWHQVEFLQQFIAALELETFHLVGHSYGGWLTAAYTIAASGTIGWDAAKTQWTSPPTPPFNGPAPQTITLIAPYNYMKPLLWETPIVDWGMAALRPIARVIGQADAFGQIDQARVALRSQPVAKSFIVDRLRPEDAIDTVERWLSAIAIPTLVIAAAQDSTIPLWHCETYGQGVVGATLEILADAAHDLIQTHPGPIAADLRQITDRLIQADS